jgi:thymidine phosphorylase
MSLSAAASPPPLKARRLGLHSQHEAVVILRSDCHVCRAEGLSARSQVLLSANGRQAFATLFQIDGDILALALQAAPLLADWIRANLGNPLIVGPDAESEQ